jgi:hypothetical protein
VPLKEKVSHLVEESEPAQEHFLAALLTQAKTVNIELEM